MNPLTLIKRLIEDFILGWAHRIEIDRMDQYYQENPEEAK